VDVEWLKDVIAVVAQHGPWAVLAFWLAYMHIKRADAQTVALVQSAEALTALKTHLELLTDLIRGRESGGGGV
jgi:uncharacterized membrane protein YccF (DUF307 family)